MAISPTVLRGAARTATGTCLTTSTPIRIHADRVLIVASTSTVRVQVYSSAQTGVPVAGDTAPTSYLSFSAGESYEIRNPQPNTLPWTLVVWGSAGGETATIQALT
jgi:hypothetical protein